MTAVFAHHPTKAHQKEKKAQKQRLAKAEARLAACEAAPTA